MSKEITEKKEVSAKEFFDKVKEKLTPYIEGIVERKLARSMQAECHNINKQIDDIKKDLNQELKEFIDGQKTH